MTLEYPQSTGVPAGGATIGGVDAAGALYQYMGSVATYADLQALDTTGFKPGYTYDVQEDGMDYSWTGTAWNALGTHTDLSGYYTSAETDILLGAKQNTLTPGNNINIDAENVISATDTTYSTFTGADGTDAGTAGLVPAPSATDNTKFLKGDGTFAEIPTPDLSNYYTKSQTYSKAEADTLLDEKQDVLTPNSPLTIETRAVSNLNGFDYTQDTTGIYTSDSSSISTYCQTSYDVTYVPMVKARVRNGGVYATNDEEFYSCGYIDIPFELNKTYSFPGMDAIFGKKDGDNFIPLFIITEASTNGTYRVTTSDTYSYSSGGDWTNLNTTGYKFDGDGFDNTTYSDGLYRASQFIEDTANYNITIRNMFPGNSDGYGRVNYYTATGDFYSRIKEATTCRLIPTGVTNAGSPIHPINLIGKWDYTGSLGGLSLSTLGTNEFDITGVETYNYLDLNIGAGLAIQDNNLVNTNPTAPSTMTGADGTNAGAAGLVPAPAATDNTKYLKGDGTWNTPFDSSAYYTKIETDNLLDEKQDTLTEGNGISIQTVYPGQIVNSYIGYKFYAGQAQPPETIATPTSVTLGTNTWDANQYALVSFASGVDTTKGLEIEYKLKLKNSVDSSAWTDYYLSPYNNSYGGGGDREALLRNGAIAIRKYPNSASLEFQYTENETLLGTFTISDASLYTNDTIYVKITKTEGGIADTPVFSIYCKEFENDTYTLIGNITYSVSFAYPLAQDQIMYICWRDVYSASPTNTIDLTDNSVSYTPVQEPYLEISTDASTVADTDLSNLTNTGKIAVAHNAMPSTTLQALTIAASGTDYIMPFDGYLHVSATSSVAPGFLSVDIDVNSTYYTLYGVNFPTVNTYGPVTLPVSKGMTVRVRYDGVTINSFVLFAANGSESEVQ